MNISCTLFEGKEGKKGKEGRTGTGNVGLIKVKDYLLPPTHSPGVDFYFYFYFRSFFLFFFSPNNILPCSQIHTQMHIW